MRERQAYSIAYSDAPREPACCLPAGLRRRTARQCRRSSRRPNMPLSKADYAEAAAIDLEIAEKHPGSEARRYAVQMLGTHL